MLFVMTALDILGSLLKAAWARAVEVAFAVVLATLGLGILLAPRLDRYLLCAGIAGVIGLTAALTKKYL